MDKEGRGTRLHVVLSSERWLAVIACTTAPVVSAGAPDGERGRVARSSGMQLHKYGLVARCSGWEQGLRCMARRAKALKATINAQSHILSIMELSALFSR